MEGSVAWVETSTKAGGGNLELQKQVSLFVQGGKEIIPALGGTPFLTQSEQIPACGKWVALYFHG